MTSSFAAIAKGDIKTAVKTIEAVLGSGLSLALGFLASAAGLTKIASSIKAALDKIQKPAQAILLKIKDWIVKMFSSLVKKVTPGSKPVTGDKSSGKPTDAPKPAATSSINISDHLVTSKMSIEGDVETHQVWAEIKGGQPIMMMASTPKEIIAHLQDFKADARVKFSNNKLSKADFDAISDHIGKSGQDVSKGIGQMRTQLKSNPRARNVTSTRARDLPESKVSADPELNKIAVNTLTSVKKRMEIAFPILNGAGISVDNLKQAVSLAGGIVQFMKDIAAGKTLGGIDRKKLGELWDLKTNGALEHRAKLKDLFRAAMPEKHEWIPSNYMLEVIDRDMDSNKIGQIPEWIDLQHKFRISTEKVIFGVKHIKIVAYRGKNYSVFQGHVGAIYLSQRGAGGVEEYTKQTTFESTFHDALRKEFKNNTTKSTVLSGIKSVVEDWIWNGVVLPGDPIHPMLRWRNNGQYLDVSKDPGLSSFKSEATKIYKEILNEIKVV